MNKLQRIRNFVMELATSQRFQMMAAMLLFGITYVVAQNTAGNYEAGTQAISTVAEENAFPYFHTSIILNTKSYILIVFC